MILKQTILMSQKIKNIFSESNHTAQCSPTDEQLTLMNLFFLVNQKIKHSIVW